MMIKGPSRIGKIHRHLLLPIGWLLLGALTVLAPWPAQARQMSSKRECALCHVMWVDAFRSDQETLIPWQGGNVLMKDTQGVVSAEDNCYSCHDGYVSDSRDIAWKGKNHPTFVTPGKKVNVPEQLPLSNKDQVYCGTCHTPHAGSEEDPNEIPLQPSSFLRVEYATSRLCAMCHGDKAEYKRTNGHPLAKMATPVPAVLKSMGSKAGPDNRSIVCQTCHQVHGARGEKISVVPDTSATLCTACHADQAAVIGSRHDLGLQKKSDQTVGAHKWGTCGGCHTPHDAKGRRLWQRPLGQGNPATGMCLSCHAQGSDYPGRGIGDISHPVDRRPTSTSQTDLPLYTSNGQPSSDRGNVQCFTCHNVHRWSPDDDSNLPPGEGQGDGRNSFLRKANGSDSALCITCHHEKSTVIQSSHNMVMSAPDAVNNLSVTPAVSGPCSACHVPHNASGWNLWARSSMGEGNPASASCLSCHGDTPGRPGKTIGRSHPVNISLPTDMASTLPRYARDGGLTPEGTVQCGTCHNVHQWQPGKPGADDLGQKNGDATNSYLRVANNGAAKLCTGCHRQNAAIADTEHNIMKMAPGAKNSRDATSALGGICSACHIPHQATDDKLWALAQGSGSDGTTRRCASCHRPEGMAEVKQVNANSHPVGMAVSKQIQETMGKSGKDALPLFAADQGDRSLMRCTTCHNAHVWQPGKTRAKVKKEVNTEGDSGTSFLRAANDADSRLCKRCHPTMARVEGTTHDMRRSAPAARNILGRTAHEAGACSACHVVHNSPFSLKMWAQPMTPAPAGQLSLNALCNSCHAANQVAAKKVPLAAGHPPGKLMTNILRKPGGGDWTPVFDQRGQRQVVGDIGCPSCHNAHEKNGGALAADTKAAHAKYLRSNSANMICAQCHGPESLYRYLYYHDPARRKRR